MTNHFPNHAPNQWSGDRERLLSLAADYLAGAATVEQAGELERLLTDDPIARAEFLRYSFLNAQLAATPVALGYAARLAGITPTMETRTNRPGETGSGETTGLGSSRAGGVIHAAGVLLAVACLALIMTEASPPRPDKARLVRHETPVSQYDNRQLPIATVAYLQEDGLAATVREIGPMTVTSRHRETHVQSANGADVFLKAESMFGFSAGDGGAIYSGSVQARAEDPARTFSVTASNLRVVDLGTAFRVDSLGNDQVAVTVLDGEVEVQSRVRLPVCYWPFDDLTTMAKRDRTAGDPPTARQTSDVVGGLVGTLGPTVEPCAGLVGRGAVRFDNKPATDVVTINGGTAAEVGTGMLAFTEGISIEMLLVSRWGVESSSTHDTIYRKDDGVNRILLAFQNDREPYDVPDVPPGPCLSFGLHLADHGYHELDMPLDGRAGRPTVAEIADGRPHHIVAMYDSFTGRKAISIDGRICFEHVYPVGTLILSGGPRLAEIGNHLSCAPFEGVIDEFALYDFALTPDEIAEHHERTRRGETYFGPRPTRPNSPRWQAITRITEGQTRIFNSRTGLAAE